MCLKSWRVRSQHIGILVNSHPECTTHLVCTRCVSSLYESGNLFCPVYGKPFTPRIPSLMEVYIATGTAANASPPASQDSTDVESEDGTSSASSSSVSSHSAQSPSASPVSPLTSLATSSSSSSSSSSSEHSEDEARTEVIGPSPRNNAGENHPPEAPVNRRRRGLTILPASHYVWREFGAKTCNYCGKEFSTTGAKSHHMARHEAVEVNAVPRFRCNHCNYTSTRKFEMDRHRINVHRRA